MTEHQEEQAALHTLTMLEPHEVRILECEARTDQRLRESVAEFEAAAAQMAFLLPEQSPPPECRGALLAALKQRRRANMVVISAPFRVFRNPMLVWAAAAALAVSTFVLWNTNRSYSSKIAALSASEASAKGEAAKLKEFSENLNHRLADSGSELTKVKNELGAEISRLNQASMVSRMEAVALRSAIKRYDEGVAIVIWDYEKQEGKLKLDKMLPVPPNKDYQLWVIDKKKAGAPVSAGVIKVDQHGVATVNFKPVEAISEMSKFALSVEKQGGVPQKSPDGPIVFIGP